MGFFANLRLRNKIFLYIFAVVAVLLAGNLLFVRLYAKRNVEEQVRQDLARTATYVMASQGAVIENLEARTNALVSAGSILRALLTDIHDPQTILEWGDQQAQNVLHAPFLLFADRDGVVMARIHAPLAHGDSLAADSFIRRAMETGAPARGVEMNEARAYDVVAVPVMAGDYAVGVLAAGYPVNEALALRLREATGCHVTFVHDGNILASTLSSEDAGTFRQKDFPGHRLLKENSTEAVPMKIGGAEYVGFADAIAVPSLAGTAPRFVLLRSVDEAMEPYVRIQKVLLAVAALTFMCALLASFWLAQSITKPVSLLVRSANSISEGNFHVALEVTSKDEMGVLAEAFNAMARGLSERMEMQKFVSASTRDMIALQSKERKIERRRVALLFSDIRGFSSLSEKVSPEEVITFVNRALSMQTDVVKKFGGDIDKFVGDELIAVFSGEDMSLRAIRCSIEIQKLALGTVLVDGKELPVRVGIGLNAGDVVFGSVGTQERQDYTVLGSPVNLCARLCSAAKEGEVILSEDAYREVSDLVKAEKMEPISAKGFEKPVAVYRIRVGTG